MKHLQNIIFFLIVFAFLDFQGLHGQQPDFNKGSIVSVPGSEEFLSKLRLNKNANGVDKITYSDIDGNPFIYKDFASGEFILKNGEVLQLNLRYDIYTGDIQFKQEDEVFALINPEDISLVLIDTLIFQHINYLKSPGDDSSIENAWFILKTTGKCKLFIKKNIRIQDAQLPKAYVGAQPAKFIPLKDMYYLKLGDNSAVRIKNKKDLLNILADKKDEIIKFIDSNNLVVNEVDYLAKIVSFYNSL